MTEDIEKQQTIDLKEGFPYLIREVRNNVFYPVKSFIFNGDLSINYCVEFSQPLSLGVNIREVPTRGLAIAVDLPQKLFIDYETKSVLSSEGTEYLIGELLNLAKVSNHDYVMFSRLEDFIPKNNGESFVFVNSPRLFNRIVDN